MQSLLLAVSPLGLIAALSGIDIGIFLTGIGGLSSAIVYLYKQQNAQHKAQVEAEKRIAVAESKLQDCEVDRKELRNEVNTLKRKIEDTLPPNPFGE